MDKKIKMLVIPSDRTGVGFYRSVGPHKYIAENYSDEFDVDIVYQMPNGDLEKFLSQYDLIHIHKQLDKECKIMDMIKFLGIPVIIDVDDHFLLGNDHPMSLTAKKERWHEPIINHLKKADCVTTTTPIFAEVLKKYNKNVGVFPNAINPKEEQFAVPRLCHLSYFGKKNRCKRNILSGIIYNCQYSQKSQYGAIMREFSLIITIRYLLSIRSS